MTFEEIKSKYPGREPAFPDHFSTPNSSEIIMNLIVNHGCNFPKSFIDFQLIHSHELSMGDFAKEGFRWANDLADSEESLSDLVYLYRKLKYPDYLTPFRLDDEGYWCFDCRSKDNQDDCPIVVFSPDKKVVYHQYNHFIDWLGETMNENY